jgi:sugar phosphate isomerase/epimerase
MNIGYVAGGATPVEVLKRAARLGFDGVELGFSWGTPCDLDTWTPDDSKRACDAVAATGAKILAVTTGWANHLAPDPTGREHAFANMVKAIEIAPQLGTNIVTCNAFGDLAQHPESQVRLFGQVFGEYARRAEDAGVRIGIENCPHCHTEHGIQIGNIAYSPALFDMLFDAVPSRAVGLEYDPSHFYWLGVDYVGALRRYADRMVYMHAKDTEVLKDRLGQVSIYGDGWWRYRMPGMGQVDWEQIARALAEIGYRTGVVIEHEDPVFEGERFEEGLSLGLKFLRGVLKN